jgi:ADP-L-glycero-D-manno-heptose 6-epimerase
VIIVTGGAGFIGSVLVWFLNQAGRSDIIIVDHLAKSEKWRNLVGLSFEEYIDKEEFLPRLESGSWNGVIDAIFHLGACSSTMETDAAYLMENNYRYTVRIGKWWEQQKSVRFVYASSAATYGDGSRGYADDEKRISQLHPMNMYGYSKHLFDLYALSHQWLSRCVGLKYFNVFGPNENHKGDMRSLINKAFPSVQSGQPMRLFKSYRPEYGDGEQLRDFIYVKDAVAMTLYFLDHPSINGIFNIGTAKARSWNDCAKALFSACKQNESIGYIPMPEQIRSKYQYYTQAEMSKLHAAGCAHQCLSLEDAVCDYVTEYLTPQKSIAGAQY